MSSETMTRRDKIVLSTIVAFVSALMIIILAITSGPASSEKYDSISDLSAERFSLICAIVMNQQMTTKYYVALRDTLDDADLRSKITSIVTDIDESIAVTVKGYNDSMQKYRRADARSHNLQYELSYEKVNSCTSE